MRTRHHVRLVVIALLLTLALASHAAADPAPSHIRTTSAALRTLIAAGIDRSPTFRALVDELDASDLIVYVEFGAFSAADAMDGRIMFVGAGGGQRYVQIIVAPLPDVSCVAILGHELRHAVEIARDRSVVGAASMARCYERIGFSVGSSVAAHPARFDTHDAVESGKRVMSEVMTARMRGNDGVRIDATPGSW